MTIDLTKCATCTNENQELKMEEIYKKYLLGTYSQEEAIQLVSKYSLSVAGQSRSSVR